MASGYEESADYGGPEPQPGGIAFAVIAIIVAGVAYAWWVSG